MSGIQHECHPSDTTIDVDTTPGLYCIRTCMGDGCNQHSVKEITSNNANELFTYKFIVLLIYFLFYFEYTRFF